MQTVSLFLFAHQDDEFGVFRHIQVARDAGHRVCCAYLTTGVTEGTSSKVRDEESVKVLARLGVNFKDIYFAGTVLAIPDGQLVRNLDKAMTWIYNWICSFHSSSPIFLPAWEGGHPDHDALHAATLTAMSGCHRFERLRQFSLYNGYGCWGPLFRVLKPLPFNGKIERSLIPWRLRFQFLRYCLSYPSQTKSWLGLLPFVFMHYFLIGTESVQTVSMLRLRERPHDGTLYYERRHFSTWSEVHSAVDACLTRRMKITNPSFTK